MDGPDFDVARLVGASEEDAARLVRRAGLELRVIHLEKSEWLTSDQRTHRVNIEVRDGTVVGAHIG